MILTRLPDLPPLPETIDNAAFRRDYFERFGKEHLLMCGRTTRAEYPMAAHPLSIKMAWNGAETYLLAHREVKVSDDAYLILNADSLYGSALSAKRPVCSLSIFVRPDVAERFMAAGLGSIEQSLDELDERGRGLGFSEHLRHAGDAVTLQMRKMHAAVLAGERDEQWLEEEVLVLLDAMLQAERHSSDAAGALAAARPSTRRELARRLRMAADFMRSNYTEPLSIANIAAAACLSQFHFVRQFRALHGISPHAFLVSLRVAAVHALVRAGVADSVALSIRAGFGSPSSMRRALARASANRLSLDADATC